MTWRHLLRFRFALLLLAFSACGEPRRAPETPPPSSAHAEIPEAHFRFQGGFPLPLVDVRVSGKDTLAILDTGAEGHVITAAFAKKNGLPTVPSAQKTYDAGGRAISLDVIEHPRIDLAGWGPIPDQPAMVIAMPELFQKLGVGIILSPQQLATASRAVVMNFPEKTLRTQASDAAVRDSAAQGGMHFGSGSVCRDPSAHTGYLLYLIPLSIHGVRANLILDTGNDGANIVKSSAAGQALSARSGPARANAVGAAGAFESAPVREVSAEIGDGERTLDVGLIPPQGDPSCPNDGTLGLEVLGTCTVTMTPDRAFVRCPR